MIKCPNCSAELKYEVGSETIKCEYCGSSFKPDELNVNVNKSEEIIDEKNSTEAKYFLCSQCGAELLTFDDTAVTFCSYCGSQAMIESRLIKINNPDYIIPFTKTKEECIKNYKKKLRWNIFAPRYMKNKIVVNKFRGIFMPYAIYKTSIHGNCSNSGEKYDHRSGDYVYYNDYALISNIDSDYEGLHFDLASTYYDKFSAAIPFNIKEKKDFNVNYLAGFYADKKDVSIEAYDEMAKRISIENASYKLSKKWEYKRYHCKTIKVPLEVSDRKTTMFPVYFLSVKDKDNKHINYAVVNGQTGKVAADIPIDFKKYIFFTLIIGIIIYLLINSNLLILPKTILKFSIVVSLISAIISNNQLNKMMIKKEKKDDLGVVSLDKNINLKYFINRDNFFAPNPYSIKTFLIAYCVFISFSIIILLATMFSNKNYSPNYIFSLFIILGMFSISIGIIFLAIFLFGQLVSLIKNRKNNVANYLGFKKMPFKEKVKKYLYKQIIALIIGFYVAILNPVNDIYYYGGGIFALLMVILSFYDLVKERNEIITNQLPQLGKRGGDENE